MSSLQKLAPLSTWIDARRRTALCCTLGGSTHRLPRWLMANASRSPVHLVQSHCCMPPLVPCSSWTLLTQHWPCCIVSPCSSWIDPTPSSSSSPVREVPFPQLPTPTLLSLCSSGVSTLCQAAICLPTDSWSAVRILMMPLCYFPSLSSLSSISSPLQWNSNTNKRVQFENDEQSIIFTRDYVWSGPQAQDASGQLWIELRPIRTNTQITLQYTSSPFIQEKAHNLIISRQNKSLWSSADFSRLLWHFLISSMKEACRKLRWRTDTAVRFWVWAKVLLNNNSQKSEQINYWIWSRWRNSLRI